MDEHLTKGSQPKTREATPECTCPIRGSGSQTGYPRVHITRQAIPGFNEKTSWIKRGCRTPVERESELESGNQSENGRRSRQDRTQDKGMQQDIPASKEAS